jgi:hypothetical protein
MGLVLSAHACTLSRSLGILMLTGDLYTRIFERSYLFLSLSLAHALYLSLFPHSLFFTLLLFYYLHLSFFVCLILWRQRPEQ